MAGKTSRGAARGDLMAMGISQSDQSVELESAGSVAKRLTPGETAGPQGEENTAPAEIRRAPGRKAAAGAAKAAATESPELSDDEGQAGGRYRAPALDKGLDILEILAAEPGGLTRSEIVRQMGMSPSQIYRMLERLVARGYVGRIGGDRHALTMRLFQLGSQHPPLRRLVAQAQPLMDRFAADMRQSCHLVVPESGAGTIIAQASPPSHFEFRARIGAQLDLFASGSGLTLLAFQAPERIEVTLRSWGIDEPSRLAPLAAELARVRAAGHRAGASRLLAGVTDLSVPVPGPSGDAAAVLTCAFVLPASTDATSPAMAGRDPSGPQLAATLAGLHRIARALIPEDSAPPQG